MSVSRGKDFQERFLLPNNTNANDLGTNTIDDQAIVWTLTGSGSSFKINSVKMARVDIYTIVAHQTP